MHEPTYQNVCRENRRGAPKRERAHAQEKKQKYLAERKEEKRGHIRSVVGFFLLVCFPLLPRLFFHLLLCDPLTPFAFSCSSPSYLFSLVPSLSLLFSFSLHPLCLFLLFFFSFFFAVLLSLSLWQLHTSSYPSPLLLFLT